LAGLCQRSERTSGALAFRAALSGVTLAWVCWLGHAAESPRRDQAADAGRWRIVASGERPETRFGVAGKDCLRLSLAAYPLGSGAARSVRHSVAVAPSAAARSDGGGSASGLGWEASGAMGMGKDDSGVFEYTSWTQAVLDERGGASIAVSYDINHRADYKWRGYGPVVTVVMPSRMASGGWVAEGVNGNEIRFGVLGGRDYLPPARRLRLETSEGVIEISVDGGHMVGGVGQGEVSVFSLSRDPVTTAGQRQQLRVTVGLPGPAPKPCQDASGQPASGVAE